MLADLAILVSLALFALLVRRLAGRVDALEARLADLTHEHAADRERLGDLERWEDPREALSAAGLACVAVDQVSDQDEPTTPGRAPTDGTTRASCDWER